MEATHKEDRLNSKLEEIIQIVEGINTLCENGSKHSISTVLYSNEIYYVKKYQKDWHEVKLKNFDEQCIYDAPLCNNEIFSIRDSIGRFRIVLVTRQK